MLPRQLAHIPVTPANAVRLNNVDTREAAQGRTERRCPFSPKEQAMRVPLAVFLFLIASPALAQNMPAGTVATPPCGQSDVHFDVKTDGKVHPMAQPEAGKAMLYFIEDDSNYQSFPKPTVRYAVDGKWIGATHGNSYFYIPIDPGEHHLCAEWQSVGIFEVGHKAAAAHLTAQAGSAYFFRMENIWIRDNQISKNKLEPLDSDEAQLLMSKFAFSISHLKK
jgi:hypothetical protein